MCIRDRSFVNPSSLLKDDEVIAEARLIESSEYIEYSFNPEQPIKLEKDANSSWGLRLYLPKSERNLKVEPFGLDCEKGSIKFKESKRTLGKNLALNECLIKVEEAYFTSSIRRSLLDQAKEWVKGVSLISPTIIQLLERDILSLSLIHISEPTRPY